MSLRGEVYKRYKMGPRTEPWGTPHKRECLSDSDTSIWTNWERSVKYDVNQSSALPLIPKLVDNRCRLFHAPTSWHQNEVMQADDHSRLHRNYVVCNMVNKDYCSVTNCNSSAPSRISFHKIPKQKQNHLRIVWKRFIKRGKPRKYTVSEIHPSRKFPLRV